MVRMRTVIVARDAQRRDREAINGRSTASQPLSGLIPYLKLVSRNTSNNVKSLGAKAGS